MTRPWPPSPPTHPVELSQHLHGTGAVLMLEAGHLVDVIRPRIRQNENTGLSIRVCRGRWSGEVPWLKYWGQTPYSYTCLRNCSQASHRGQNYHKTTYVWCRENEGNEGLNQSSRALSSKIKSIKSNPPPTHCSGSWSPLVDTHLAWKSYRWLHTSLPLNPTSYWAYLPRRNAFVLYNFLKEIHFPFYENAVSFTWPRNAVEVPTQVPFPLDPRVWKRPNLLAPPLCQVPARWLRASFLLILTPPKLYFTFSLILQRGDGFKEEKQVTYSHLGSVTIIPYTSCSLTNNNKKLKTQDFISWLPKFCFWIQWHDPAIQAVQGGDWATNPPSWAGPGGRQGEGTAAHCCLRRVRFPGPGCMLPR